MGARFGHRVLREEVPGVGDARHLLPDVSDLAVVPVVDHRPRVAGDRLSQRPDAARTERGPGQIAPSWKSGVPNFASSLTSTCLRSAGFESRYVSSGPRSKRATSPYASATPLRKQKGSRAYWRPLPIAGSPLGPGGWVRIVG
ncbi:MAG: hypothetical protein ABEK02_03760 [Haloquadratum sp.]